MSSTASSTPPFGPIKAGRTRVVVAQGNDPVPPPSTMSGLTGLMQSLMAEEEQWEAANVQTHPQHRDSEKPRDYVITPQDKHLVNAWTKPIKVAKTSPMSNISFEPPFVVQEKDIFKVMQYCVYMLLGHEYVPKENAVLLISPQTRGSHASKLSDITCIERIVNYLYLLPPSQTQKELVNFLCAFLEEYELGVAVDRVAAEFVTSGDVNLASEFFRKPHAVPINVMQPNGATATVLSLTYVPASMRDPHSSPFATVDLGLPGELPFVKVTEWKLKHLQYLEKHKGDHTIWLPRSERDTEEDILNNVQVNPVDRLRAFMRLRQFSFETSIVATMFTVLDNCNAFLAASQIEFITYTWYSQYFHSKLQREIVEDALAIATARKKSVVVNDMFTEYLVPLLNSVDEKRSEWITYDSFTKDLTLMQNNGENLETVRLMADWVLSVAESKKEDDVDYMRMWMKGLPVTYINMFKAKVWAHVSKVSPRYEKYAPVIRNWEFATQNYMRGL